MAARHAFGPVEFLLKVPLFVPFVVVGHALRVFWSPYVPGLSSSWAGIAMALAWKHLGLAEGHRGLLDM